MSDRYHPRHIRPTPSRRYRPLRLAAVLSFVILVAMASMPVRVPQRQFVVIPPTTDPVAPVEQFPVLADPPLGSDEPEQPEERSEGNPSTPEPSPSASRGNQERGEPMTNPHSAAFGGRTFEELLTDPYEQYDARSELLASIVAYASAPPATAGSRPWQPGPRLSTASPTPAPASSPTAVAAIPACHPEPPTKPTKTKEPKRG